MGIWKPIFFQWASRAERKLPSPSLLDHKYEYDGEVLIIGAGASGLAAARLMEDNNISFSILEATDRIGGRTKEYTGFANFPVDLGAEWIHNLPSILTVLSGDDTVETIDLVRQWMTDAHSWNKPNLKRTPSFLWAILHWFMPEYKFQKSTWYDFVTNRVATKTVKDRVQLNAPVEEIDYRGPRAIVTTRDGKKHIADKVIVTASVGVLQSGSIRFVPELPQDKKTALETIHFPKGIKIALKFSKRFYPELVMMESLLSGSNGEKEFYDMAFGKGDSADHVLGLLVTADAVESYYRLDSEEDIVKAVLKELDEIFDGQATQFFVDYRLEDWGNHEFTQGTWVEGFRIKKPTLQALARPLDDKIYFAGEATDKFQQMGVPGAVLSGYKAVFDIVPPERS